MLIVEFCRRDSFGMVDSVGSACVLASRGSHNTLLAVHFAVRSDGVYLLLYRVGIIHI